MTTSERGASRTFLCSPMGTNARGVAQCDSGHGDYPDACREATVTVTRRGDVLRNGRLIGSVDRHDGHLGPYRQTKTWRYVTDGGRSGPDRYPTRAAAVAALAAL